MSDTDWNLDDSRKYAELLREYVGILFRVPSDPGCTPREPSELDFRQFPGSTSEQIRSRLRDSWREQRREHKRRVAPSISEKAGAILLVGDEKSQLLLEFVLQGIETLSREELRRGDPGRLAMLVALDLTLGVLRRVPGWPTCSATLTETVTLLLEKLESQERGERDGDLVSRQRRRGRQRATARQRNFRIRCVLAANALEELGYSDPNGVVVRAATATARLVVGERPRYPFGVSMVQNWRDEFRAERSTRADGTDEFFAQAFYDLAVINGELSQSADVYLRALAPEFIDLPLPAAYRSLNPSFPGGLVCFSVQTLVVSCKAKSWRRNLQHRVLFIRRSQIDPGLVSTLLMARLCTEGG